MAKLLAGDAGRAVCSGAWCSWKARASSRTTIWSGFAGHGLYNDVTFVLGFLFVFTSRLYLVVYMTTSISEQLRLRQQDLEKANAQLQEKDQVKNEYVLRVTHDIKGHLAAIAELLWTSSSTGCSGRSTTSRRTSWSGPTAGRRKCMAFVIALLKLTRMKLSGRLEVERFSLRNCVLSSLASVQNRAREKSIVLQHQIDPAVNEVTGEAVLIEETITNMLFNAVKYTPAGGRVGMEVKPDGDVRPSQDRGHGHRRP